ncbi:MAG: hypothetical protein R3C44_21910 [Chloroflexota bacterium]
MTDRFTNEGLTYVFLGFTDDGQYFISFFYPIETPELPAIITEALDSVEMESLSADIESYMAERAAALNTLSPSSWSPNLETLDASHRFTLYWCCPAG